MLYLKVKNIISSSGNAVSNQFIIEDSGNVYYQSYNSLIARWDGVELLLGKDWDYSVTTLKYLYIWLEDYCWQIWRQIKTSGNKRKAIQALIDNGVISYNPEMK